jgi:hypothetical protein
MSGKTDVWYVGLGALYAYQYTRMVESETSGNQMTVTVSPTSVNADVGQQQTFSSVVSGGDAPYSYQWYLNDNPVSDATDSTWTFTPSQAGSFNVYVIVTDEDGRIAQSNTVTNITVYAEPSVSINPASVNLAINSTQQFTSTVTGGLISYTYRWYYTNGTALPKASTSTLTYKANSPGTYNFYLNVTDHNGFTAMSNIATAAAETPMNVTITPTQVRIHVSQSQTFDSSISGGTSPQIYQWYLNNSAVPGATDMNWNYTPTSIGNYTVYLNVTDALNFAAQSNIVTNITVDPAVLSVSVSSTSWTMNVGQSQTFTATPTGGSGAYTSYKWYVNGVVQPSQTASTFSFVPASAGSYSITVTVSDSLGATSVQPSAATVTASVPVSTTPTPIFTSPPPTVTATPKATAAPAHTPTPSVTRNPSSTASPKHSLAPKSTTSVNHLQTQFQVLPQEGRYGTVAAAIGMVIVGVSLFARKNNNKR